MRLVKPPKKVWGIGGSFVVLAGVVVGGIQLKNQRKQQALIALNELTYASQSDPELKSTTYHLVEGWNFISFPFAPTSVQTASELVKDIVKQGGYVTMVSRWQTDHWQTYVQRGMAVYGDDFQLPALEGIFVSCQKAVDWQVSGLVGGSSLPGYRQLKPGWNAVGFVDDSGSASQVLNTISNGDDKKAQEIDYWISGNWDVFVKRWYTPTNIQEYGDDFKLNQTRGYMIHLLKEGTVPNHL